MRVHLIMLALLGGCGSDETAIHFCQNVRMVFHELAAGDLEKARRALGENGRCSDLDEAGSSLKMMRMTFKAAAVPFRGRSEVDKALNALDKLTLDELTWPIRCGMKERSAMSNAEVAEIRAALDNVETKLAAVVATCPPR